jgi:Fe-S-cluster containining protein
MICPVCSAYMLDKQDMPGWKHCSSCGYSCDEDGYNLLNPKPKNPIEEIVKKVEELPVTPYVSIESKENAKGEAEDVPIVGIKIDF